MSRRGKVNATVKASVGAIKEENSSKSKTCRDLTFLWESLNLALESLSYISESCDFSCCKKKKRKKNGKEIIGKINVEKKSGKNGKK